MSDTTQKPPSADDDARPVAIATARACTNAILELGNDRDIYVCVGEIATALRAVAIDHLRRHYAGKPAHRQPTEAQLISEAHHFVRRMWTGPLDDLVDSPFAVHLNRRAPK